MYGLILCSVKHIKIWNSVEKNVSQLDIITNLPVVFKDMLKVPLFDKYLSNLRRIIILCSENKRVAVQIG